MRFTIIITLLALTSLSLPKDSLAQDNAQQNINIYLKNIKNISKARFKNYAKIQILDKTTAKSLEKTIATGEKYSYGNINITPYRCWRSPPSRKPNSKILLEINEVNPKDKQDIANIFTGWMISASPSVSGLEHPIYDITVIDCID